MRVTLDAIYDGAVLRILGPAKLKAGRRYVLTVEEFVVKPGDPEQPISEELAERIRMNEEMDHVCTTGRTIYEERLKAILEPQFNGQEVTIHIDTGDYEVGKRWDHSSTKLRDRHPEGGLLYTRNIGPPRPEDDMLGTRILAGQIQEEMRLYKESKVSAAPK